MTKFASMTLVRARARRGRTAAPPPGVAAGLLALFGGAALVGGACSATGKKTEFGEGGGGSDITVGSNSSSGLGGAINPSGSGGGGAGVPVADPTTCAEAATSRSYVGCDFYPTVVDNIVDSLFDYAVVAGNAGDTDADVTVTRKGATVATATVPANGLAAIYLPWVDELKSKSPFTCVSSNPKTATVRADGGAYHLVSTRPITLYQFSAIEYAGKGGPPNKDWSACSGFLCLNGCFSFTNDASLLLPSTALTGNYRITGPKSWLDPDPNGSMFEYPPYFAVTGVKDGTSVTVNLSNTASIVAGGGVPAAGPGGKVTFSLNAGDVVEVVGGTSAHFGGSLVQASAPVQVISGISCTNMPSNVDACDHTEESVLPAETLGKHYFVTVPTSPQGQPVAAVVRIYGNVDSTTLSYPGTKPPGAPSTINAGQVVDLGMLKVDFEIVGDHEFAVELFSVGAALVDPGVPTNKQKGDPDQTQMITVEQYRKKYIFLAPTDYDVSFVDIVQPLTAQITLDGSPVGAPVTPLSSGFGIARVQLGPGNNGAHVLTGTEPFGIQVMGYGTYTSYQYPGGLNLGQIAPPPPPPQ